MRGGGKGRGALFLSDSSRGNLKGKSQNCRPAALSCRLNGGGHSGAPSEAPRRARGRPSWAARPSARERPALPAPAPPRRAGLLARRGRGARRPFGRRRVRELCLVKDGREAKPPRRTESRKQPPAGFRPLAAACAAGPGAFPRAAARLPGRLSRIFCRGASRRRVPPAVRQGSHPGAALARTGARMKKGVNAPEGILDP